MRENLKRPRIPDHLYSVCNYFFPRIMFLQSTYAAQTHWGDIVIALNDFPKNCLDLSSSEFWECWMERWAKLGDDYCHKSNQSTSESGKRRLFRSAAACYHWSEFMYFSNSIIKTCLRNKVKNCFKQSLDPSLPIKHGSIKWNEINIPYYLIFPNDIISTTNSIPCVILSNGLDSVTEVEIFAIAEQFLARGIATFLFDGPGQGINLGCNRLEIKFELVVEHIIQTLSNEKQLDMNNMAFFGVSFGGYLALRVANFIGQHFKCVINLSGGPYLSPFDTMPRRLKEDFKYTFMETNNKNMQSLFDNLSLEMSNNCQTEILSIHGMLDDIFPIEGLKKIDALLKNHTLETYESEAHVCLNYINQYIVEIADWTSTKLSNKRIPTHFNHLSQQMSSALETTGYYET